jgi:hypothetical protein
VCFELNALGCILILSSCTNGERDQMARRSVAFFRFANGRIFLCSCKDRTFFTKFLKKKFSNSPNNLQDYTVSISCQDQLSPTGGNFDLDFSRISPKGATGTGDAADSFNPHEDAEPFLRDILRHGHGRLVPSLHRLVTRLRDTLPIVVELEAIRKEGRQRGRNLDIFAKAAGWYRLLYGDLKYVVSLIFVINSRFSFFLFVG